MIRIKRMNRVYLLAAMLAMPLPVVSAELDVDELLKDLEDRLDVAKDRMEYVQPKLRDALEDKNSELKSSMDEAMERGLVELENMGEKYSKATEEAGDKLRDVLESDEVEQLKSFLAELDEDAIREARDRLSEQLTELLELSKDQIDDIKPLLSEMLEDLGKVLHNHMKDAESSFEKFRDDFEKEGKKRRERFEEILDSDQIRKFEDQIESFKESVRNELPEKA